MRNIAVILRLLTCLCCLCATTRMAHAGDLLSNLISYWALDESSGGASDSYGSNSLAQNGTVGNATGKIKGARSFSSGNYLSIASNSTLQTGNIDFSLAAWVKFNSFGADRAIVAKWNSFTTNRDYVLKYSNSDGNFIFQVSPDGSTFQKAVWNQSVSTGTWYFVAGGHNAAADELWISIDGATPVVQSHSAGVQATGAAFTLGSTVAGNENHDGLIDEAGFWKRDVRSDLTQLYHAGNGLGFPFGRTTRTLYFARSR